MLARLTCGACVASRQSMMRVVLPQTAAIISHCVPITAVNTKSRFLSSYSRILLDASQSHPSSGSSSTSSSGPAAAADGGAASSESALDVAMRVNKMKRMHQTGTGAGPASKKQVEQEAWTALNSLTDEQINAAEGKAVALLLNSWAYFAKFWEKGKDGPGSAEAPK